MEFLLKGLVIGFAIAAPVGPIGVLTIQRTLARGWGSGLATGLGAASADAVYGAVAAFGLSAIGDALLEARPVLQAGGGVFLCLLGVRVASARPAAAGPAGTAGRSAVGCYVSALALTLANPLTILSFAAIFAGAGLALRAADAATAVAMVAGVFTGSAVWWLVLSSAVERGRRRWLGRSAVAAAVQTGVTLGAAGDVLRRINFASGALLAGFGLWALLGTFLEG